MKRVLLLLPTTGYRNNDFLAAAKKVGVEFASGSSRLNTRASARAFGLVYQRHDRRQDRSVVACGCGDAVPLEHAPVGVESGNLDLGATEVDAYA
jgi:hypothetical protein